MLDYTPQFCWVTQVLRLTTRISINATLHMPNHKIEIRTLIHQMNFQIGDHMHSKLMGKSYLDLTNQRLKLRYQGAVSIRKTVLPGMAIPMLKIRRPNGRLIFNMEIAIRR